MACLTDRDRAGDGFGDGFSRFDDFAPWNLGDDSAAQFHEVGWMIDGEYANGTIVASVQRDGAGPAGPDGDDLVCCRDTDELQVVAVPVGPEVRDGRQVARLLSSDVLARQGSLFGGIRPVLESQELVVEQGVGKVRDITGSPHIRCARGEARIAEDSTIA